MEPKGRNEKLLKGSISEEKSCAVLMVPTKLQTTTINRRVTISHRLVYRIEPLTICRRLLTLQKLRTIPKSLHDSADVLSDHRKAQVSNCAILIKSP